jgi:hypothetical protein
MAATPRRKGPNKQKDHKPHAAEHSSDRIRESLERALEEGLLETFPASDPVAAVQPLPSQWGSVRKKSNH